MPLLERKEVDLVPPPTQKPAELPASVCPQGIVPSGDLENDEPPAPGTSPIDALGARRIGVHGGIAELLLDGLVLIEERLHGVEHGVLLPADQRMLFSCPWL